MSRLALALMLSSLIGGCATNSPKPDRSELEKQVIDRERAFARTMADRDLAAFTGFLSEEAVFLGGAEPLRGKTQVVGSWRGMFEAAEAPFSWEPEQVHVLDSGMLALSSGPVRDPEGKQFATYTSIWRLEAPGTWRIVFDKGCPICEPEKK